MNHFNNFYRGYLDTPLLWKNDLVYDIRQYTINHYPVSFTNTDNANKIRLGKLIEMFVSHQLKQDRTIVVLCENILIQDHKKTIGELDLLLKRNEVPIHLEVAFKFYLFDYSQSHHNKLECWIGPNRKDSLIYKLNKLKQKQLPLLYSDSAGKTLEKLKFDIRIADQYVHFKAQLFVPLDFDKEDIYPWNKDCIKGYYISQHQIQILKSFKIYIPSKLEWLLEPSHNVKWLNYGDAAQKIMSALESKKSPMIWVNRYSAIDKYFITWW